MHGVVLSELQGFVASSFGADIWRQMTTTAGLGSRLYLPVGTYPDGEAVALLEAAVRLSGKSLAELAGAFGEYLARICSRCSTT